jgi:tetratricopeptide (TPR) repeat protein
MPRTAPAAVARPETPAPADAASPVLDLPEPSALAAEPSPEPAPEASGAPSAADSRPGARPKPESRPAKPAPAAPDRAELTPKEATAAANRYYIEGDLARAKDLFKRAIRTSPRYAPAHRGLGLVYEKLGRKANAARSFRTYLRLVPEASDANVIRDRIEKLGS